MSYLFRWVRYNQSLLTRSTTLLATENALETTAILSNIKPLYQITRQQPIMTSSLGLSPDKPPLPPLKDQKVSNEKKDDIKYVINFRQGIDVKKVFKEFYSLYGPLFVVCHIGIGLISLGFFCSLTWFAIDLTKIAPDFLIQRIGETMTTMTGAGGKFVVAYAIHKLLLPVRLAGAIFVTRALSRVIKKYKKTA